MVSTKTLAYEKLISSGLDPEDLDVLKMEIYESATSCFPRFHDIPALKINYHNPLNPKELLSPFPKWPGFFRVRYLKDPPTEDKKAKPQRYAQPPDTGVCAYFPTFWKWPGIFKDTDIPLIITEGELKAAKASKDGRPAIGLGGVFNFKSARFAIPFLPELEKINWIRRNVYIIYDSDFRTNPAVCRALNELAECLEDRGAFVSMTQIPAPENGDTKMGIDDFLVAYPGELDNLIDERSTPLTLAKPLWQMNNEILYVHNPGLIVVRETKQKISPQAFTAHAYSTQEYSQRILKDDGSVSLQKVSAAPAWLSWPLRYEVGAMTYAPGEGEIVNADSVRQTAFNIWPGWGVEPKKGNVKPFLKLVEYLFTGSENGDKDWFLKWCAYPIQHPGAKLFTSAVLYGVRHGTGKSLLGYTLGKIYGRNFTEISQSDLHSSFNEWAEGKQFILGDDVTGSNKRQDADLLKKLITQKEVRVNVKFVPSYTVPDCINYYFTSNQPDAFFLEDDDRRFFIHEIKVGPLEEAFYNDYNDWLHGDGPRFLMDHLLKMNLAGFNPHAPARRTSAKERMIADVRSDLGDWVRRMMESPDELLKFGDIVIEDELVTNQQLLNIYDPAGRTGTTANGLGRELRRASLPYVCNGTPIKTDKGKQRLYIVRNVEKWLKASAQEVTDYINKGTMKTKKDADRPQARKKKF